jgi:hypothetical protein
MTSHTSQTPLPYTQLRSIFFFFFIHTLPSYPFRFIFVLDYR